MSQPTHNTSLSLSARLVAYLGPPSAILLTASGSPSTALITPLTFIPTAAFFENWRRGVSSKDPNASVRGDLEPMVWIYSAMATLGVPAAGLVQLGCGYAFVYLLFGTGSGSSDFLTEFMRPTVHGLTPGELAYRAELARSWQYWAFTGLTCFSAMALAEETLKYLPALYGRRRRHNKRSSPSEKVARRDRSYLDYAVAGALSFGLVENIAYIYASATQPDANLTKIVTTVAGRLFFGSIGHVMLASLSAIREIRRDVYGEPMNWLQVVAPATLIHGAFNSMALMFSSLEGNVGWIHPTGLWNQVMMYGSAFTVFAGTSWLVKKELAVLEGYEQGVKSD